MTTACYSVTVLSGKPIDYDGLAAELAQYEDWIRLGDSVYFVLTERHANDVKNSFRTRLSADDHVFLVTVDIFTANGWTPRQFTSWVFRAQDTIIAERQAKLAGSGGASGDAV